MQGYGVAEAVLVEIDNDQAILEIPATRIVMGIKSSLGDLTPDPNAKERMLLGVQEPEVPEDEIRAALEAEGIELDEEPDFIAPQHVSQHDAGEASLKDMNLNGIN